MHRPSWLLLFAALLLLWCRAALAAPLSPDAVGSYLSVAGGRVVVVAAGAYAACQPVAQQVRDALSRAQQAGEVVPGEFLGNVEYLTDADIVAQLAGKPFDEVVIVRVLPGQAQVAQVRFYHRMGRLLTTFQLTPGERLKPRPPPPPLPAVPTATPRPPDPVPAGPPPRKTPEAAATPAPPAADGTNDDPAEESVARQRTNASFEEGHLGVHDIQMSRWTYDRRRHRYRRYTEWVMVAYQGGAEHIIPWEIFYELVGRPDLLAAYQARTATHARLSFVGGISLVAGLGAMLAAGLCARLEDKQPAYALAGTGGVLLLSGLIESLVAALRSPHAISRAELQRLADEHNRELSERFPPPAPAPENGP